MTNFILFNKLENHGIKIHRGGGGPARLILPDQGISKSLNSSTAESGADLQPTDSESSALLAFHPYERCECGRSTGDQLLEKRDKSLPTTASYGKRIDLLTSCVDSAEEDRIAVNARFVSGQKATLRDVACRQSINNAAATAAAAAAAHDAPSAPLPDITPLQDVEWQRWSGGDVAPAGEVRGQRITPWTCMAPPARRTVSTGMKQLDKHGHRPRKQTHTRTNAEKLQRLQSVGAVRR